MPLICLTLMTDTIGLLRKGKGSTDVSRAILKTKILYSCRIVVLISTALTCAGQYASVKLLHSICSVTSGQSNDHITTVAVNDHLHARST